jgi:hypothetical protein
MQKAFMTGRPVNPGGETSPRYMLMLLICVLAFFFSLSLVYMGMRGVMRLGGFVASGGPYHIAHQAPGWVWIFPVSIFMMLGAIFTSLFAGSKAGGPNLMALSWSALFLALGWNFVEFGFGIGTGGGLAWGWVICAVLFILMGGVPLLVIVNVFLGSIRDRRERGNSSEGMSWGISLALQAAAAAAGVYLGLSFFRVLA